MFLLCPALLLVFYGLPYYFFTVLWTASASVYCNASVTLYHCACAAQIRSPLSFFKLTCTRNEAVHETCFSSWSGVRDLTCFMFLLWPTLLLVFYSLPYYFPLFCKPRVWVCIVTRACILYHCACVRKYVRI